MDEVDEIFYSLQPEALSQVAGYLRWDPEVSSSPFTLLSQLSPQHRLAWLSQHRVNLAHEVCAVGSRTLGRRRPYSEIVRDLAQRVGAACSESESTSDIEVKIIKKVFEDAWAKLTPEERKKFDAEVEKLAAKYKKNAKGTALAFTALSIGQLSGFGVYVLASTLLGGLGLSFGFFTGLSTLISVVIGPVGWIGLGLAALSQLGSPNYKKLLPVVVLVGIERQTARQRSPLRRAWDRLRRAWGRLCQALARVLLKASAGRS